MIEEIKTFLKYKSNNAVKLIPKNFEMWNWILSNCDPLCIDNKTRIYTAITGEKILCPCGSGKLRKLRSINKGLIFCGGAGTCNAAKESVSKKCKEAAKLCDKVAANIKRTNTNLDLYGVTNIGQTDIAKLARKEFYKDANKVKKMQEKIKTTCLEIYNCEHAAQNPIVKEKTHATLEARTSSQKKAIRDKTIDTWMKNLKVINPGQSTIVREKITSTNLKEYGVPNAAQIHFGQYVYEILSDKEKFANELSNSNVNDLSKKLGVSKGTIFSTHHRYNLDIIKSYGSSYEEEIDNWLKTLISDPIIRNNRKICTPYQLDFVIESKKLAIEFNGLYWHSEYSRNRNQYYHINKLQKCEQANYRLITIFEDEWLASPDICKSIISQSLGISKRIGARKCIVEEIKNVEIKEFLNINHLQGWVNGSRAFVLKYQNEIVAAMTFGRPRYNKHAEWELLRLATKINSHVMGGTEKLWNFSVNKINPASIISYCDRRWFTGNVYEKLGFIRSKISTASYTYTDYNTRWHRSKFTKKNLLEMSKDNNLNPDNEDWSLLTGDEIARYKIGLDKIWDCGQDSWLWSK